MSGKWDIGEKSDQKQNRCKAMIRIISRDRITLFLLAIALMVQIWILANNYVRPLMLALSHLSSESAIMRSATIFHGSEFAEYIEFVREVVPENARVLLPPNKPVQPMANVGLMQFYLFPRELHNCGVDEVEACLQRNEDSDLFILTAWKFPPDGWTSQNRQFIQLQGESGIYAPLP